MISYETMDENSSQPDYELLGSTFERKYPSEYYRTLSIACDIDKTFLDPDTDTSKTVRQKVGVLNKFLPRLEQQADLDIYFTFLTQKPAATFFNQETSPLYGPLLNIHPRSPLILCEFGAVSLTRNNDSWTTHLNDDVLGNSYNLLDKFTAFLRQQKLISESGKADANFPYRLEPGNLAYISLQMPDGRPMPKPKKLELLAIIKKGLEQAEFFDVLEFFQFGIDKADFDCIPQILATKSKDLGIEKIIIHMHQNGMLWFDRRHLLIVDDKVQAAGIAAERILESGGLATAPANADQALKNIISHIGLGGRNSRFPVFQGALNGIYQAVVGNTFISYNT